MLFVFVVLASLELYCLHLFLFNKKQFQKIRKNDKKSNYLHLRIIEEARVWLLRIRNIFFLSSLMATFFSLLGSSPGEKWRQARDERRKIPLLFLWHFSRRCLQIVLTHCGHCLVLTTNLPWLSLKVSPHNWSGQIGETLLLTSWTVGKQLERLEKKFGVFKE